MTDETTASLIAYKDDVKLLAMNMIKIGYRLATAALCLYRTVRVSE